MKKALLLSTIVSLIFLSCTEKDSHPNSDEIKFYLLPRETVFNETFDSGYYASTIDSISVDTNIGAVFRQDGVCATIEKGYLNTGCNKPFVLPYDITPDRWRTYRFGVAFKLMHFKSSYPLNNYELLSSKIGIQIDYHTGGLTELHIGNFIITNTIIRPDLDNSTLHIMFNINSQEIQAFLNGKDVSNKFVVKTSSERSFEFVFWVKSFIEKPQNGGYTMLNFSGIRIDQIEVYNF